MALIGERALIQTFAHTEGSSLERGDRWSGALIRENMVTAIKIAPYQVITAHFGIDKSILMCASAQEGGTTGVWSVTPSKDHKSSSYSADPRFSAAYSADSV